MKPLIEGLQEKQQEIEKKSGYPGFIALISLMLIILQIGLADRFLPVCMMTFGGSLVVFLVYAFRSGRYLNKIKEAKAAIEGLEDLR
jgi:hypothetical protein